MPIRSIIPTVVILIAIWIIVLIPFKIIGYGFLPPDDATRHSAKVISGKDWSQILVLRDEVKMDSHPGWNAVLTFVHRLTGWDAHSLVLFSSIALFVLCLVIPFLFLKYPEAWLVSLTALALVVPGLSVRLMLGRPFIISMASLLVFLFIWPLLKEKKFPAALSMLLTLFIAVTFWIHANWYFFGMLVVIFLLAREWRVALRIGVCSAIGILIGALFTAHPAIFIKQDIWRLFFVFRSADAERLLVGELQPGYPDIGAAILVLGMLGWRALRGKWERRAVDNPVFILACVAFIFGIVSKRIWVDWGLMAVAVWVANEFDAFFAEKGDAFVWRRVLVTAIAGMMLFIIVTTDIGSRWSMCRPRDYISAEDLEQAPWLPEKGGILYSGSMDVFYQTFFKNPHGNWRYILGFESAFMPQEDLNIVRDIQRNYGLYNYYYPWVKKMTPRDRLIIRGSPDSKPKIPELEWYYVAHGTWSGRLPHDKKLPKN